MFIKEVTPKIIKNSRGEKTLQVTLKTYKGTFVASAPSGKSKGKSEVAAYNQGNIDRSLTRLRIICARLKHQNFLIKKFDQMKLLEDEILKVEHKYGYIGGNARYALGTAFLKAVAKDNKKDLWEFIFDSFYKGKKPRVPMPVGNCIGGGAHSTGKKPDFQEFLLIPKEKTYAKAVTKMIHTYESAKHVLKRSQKKYKAKKNDENAWQTTMTNEDTLEVLYQLGQTFGVRIGLDMAASGFCSSKGYYHYKNKELIRDRMEQIEYVERLIEKYKIFYIEDPLDEEDFSGFMKLTKGVKNSLIVGDDLTTTNLQRLKRAIKIKAINSLIVKPNQIGSFLEVAEVVKLCKKHDVKVVFSHRSGETMDDALADFAVGFQADFMKAGIMGKERLVKLRRVMQIERKINR